MATTNVKILLRRGLRKEISADTLETAELGFANDSNQLYVGTDAAINEVIFDPFVNAHAVIQSWLNSTDNPEPGLKVDEDLVIRGVSDVDALILAMSNTAAFNVHEFGRPRRNVEVVTENSFNQMFADQHLQLFDPTTGLRSSLFNKKLETVNLPVGALEPNKQHRITVLGDTDWNALLGTTGVTYNVGDTFTPTTTGTTVQQATYDYTGSDFALNKWDGTAWQTQTVDLLQDAPGTGNVKAEVNGYAYPIDAYGNDGDFAVVASTAIIVYYQKVGGVWQKLGVDTFTAQPTYSATAPTTAQSGISGDLWVDTSSLSLKLDGTTDVTTIYTDSASVDSVNNAHWILLNETLNYLTHGVRDLLVDGRADLLDGIFLKYNKNTCTTFFIDYSLKQTNGTVTYVRVGTLKAINGTPQGINQVKMTDDNTEIWQDDGDGIAEADEFSNIEFTASINGDDLLFEYTQDAGFTTDISFTVKRWTM